MLTSSKRDESRAVRVLQHHRVSEETSLSSMSAIRWVPILANISVPLTALTTKVAWLSRGCSMTSPLALWRWHAGDTTKLCGDVHYVQEAGEPVDLTTGPPVFSLHSLQAQRASSKANRVAFWPEHRLNPIRGFPQPDRRTPVSGPRSARLLVQG